MKFPVRPILLASALLASAVPVRAGTVTVQVTDMANSSSAPGVSDVGTFSIETFVADDTAQPQTLVARVDGLTLDADGTANDSVLLSFTVGTDGQKIQTSTTTGTGWFSSGGNYLNASGEFVQITYAGMTVNLSGGGTGSGSFVGFTGGQVGSWGDGDVADIVYDGGTLTRDYHEGDGKPFTLPNGATSQSLKFLWHAGTFRALSYSFSFVASDTPVSLPVIHSFTADPDTIASGGSSTLAWDTTGADTLEITPAPGAVSGDAGSVSVSPTETTTYTLTATNADGSVSRTATVTVEEVRPPPATGHPNILVILADDMSWTDMHTGLPNLGHGSTYHQTPHIDRLADEGLCFTSFYVHQNCAPTRAALLSGQYPPRSGNGVYNVGSLHRGTNTADPPPALDVPSQNEDVPAAHYTIAEMLWDAGYVTCHVGKYHVGGHEGGASTMPENQGFDFNYGGGSAGSPGSFFAQDLGGGHYEFESPTPSIDPFAAPYATDYINTYLAPYANGNDPSTLAGSMKHLVDAEVDAVIDFLDNHRGGPLSAYPFYLQYHSYAVHSPIQPRPDLKTKYKAITSTDPRHTRADYAGHVEGLDQGIGRILDYLDDPNGDGDPSDSIAENTLVIFMSDNGGAEPETENSPLRSRKGAIYEGGIRAPLILRQPGTIPANLRTDTLVHAVDLFATLMEVAGGSTPEITDGVSYYQHALDPAGHPRNRAPVFYHFPGYLDNRIRPCDVVIKDVGGKRYKLIYNYDYAYDPKPDDDGIKALDQPWELYCLTEDLSETTNLVGDGNYWNDLLYGPIADEMAADLRAWLEQSDPTWNAPKLTRKSDGATVPYPPSSISHPSVPFEQTFRILDGAADTSAGTVTLTFRSAAGYHYDILASSSLDPDPAAWTTIASDIPGQDGSTTVSNIPDPPSATAPRRFYKVVLKP